MRAIIAFTLPLFIGSAVDADAQGLTDSTWTLEGGTTRVAGEAGAFRIVSGRARLAAAEFRDGTIEFDVTLAEGRAFTYLEFRTGADGGGEEIYFRNHKADLPDAIQYAPVNRRQSAWQLFHGPGGTAAYPLPVGRPMHVRLEVRDTKAVLFVNRDAAPAMVMRRLGRVPRAGGISLRGFVPQGSPATHAGVFRNIVVKPGVTTFRFDTLAAPDDSAGTAVRDWALSAPFLAPDGHVGSLPAIAGARTAVRSRASGLVILDEYLTRPPGTGRPAVLATFRLSARAPTVQRIDLGFSDAMTLFVNGQPLLSADARYSYDLPRQEGLMGPDQAVAYVPLRAGVNEITVLVADVFGGWGLMARLTPVAGVSVQGATP